MGLDSVELIMNVERAFDIELPDPEISKVVTVGDFYDLIIVKLELNNPNIDRQEVWETLSKLIVKISGVAPHRIVREARIVKDLGID
ncbi:MAG: hypothetical protein JNM12_00705 [Alphaproteobacteria bacterium]|nr:hypothetical protein [Alphaproteobacteria bacterium]